MSGFDGLLRRGSVRGVDGQLGERDAVDTLGVGARRRRGVTGTSWWHEKTDAEPDCREVGSWGIAMAGARAGVCSRLRMHRDACCASIELLVSAVALKSGWRTRLSSSELSPALGPMLRWRLSDRIEFSARVASMATSRSRRFSPWSR